MVRRYNVLIVTHIPAEVPGRTIDISKYEHLKDLPVDLAMAGAKVNILIGMDYPELLMPLNIRHDSSKTGIPMHVLRPWVRRCTVRLAVKIRCN